MFLLLGIVGLVIPVMPQLLFFAMAMLLAAPDFPPARRLLTWAFRRWPKLRRSVPRKMRNLAETPASHADTAASS